MRPLNRPPMLSAKAQTEPAAALLMHAFGPYCAFSEEPLFDVVGVWNRTGGESADPTMPPGGDWNDVLLVSPTTLIAAQGLAAGNVGAMLAPDVDETFALDASPFVYAFAPVTLILLDDEGRAADDGKVCDMAIVTGTTAAARATIDTFALNGRYAAADGTMRMPASAYLAREDNRPFLRTEVWLRAEQVADQIAAIDAAMRPMLLEQVRMLAAASGFWSVWATVLWNRFGDHSMLAAVLLPHRPAARDAAGAAMLAGSAVLQGGLHLAFPGTRVDWLT